MSFGICQLWSNHLKKSEMTTPQFEASPTANNPHPASTEITQDKFTSAQGG
jgi:hypothetical protein